MSHATAIEAAHSDEFELSGAAKYPWPAPALRQAGLKRTLDFVGASLLLLLLSPVLLLVTVLIRLDSRGPALFVQERVGLAGRRFPIFKFRTMYVGSSSDQHRVR